MSAPFAFILDQQVGLRTHALNIERVVRDEPAIQPTWVPVRYAANAGWLAHLPCIPGGIRGTLRGVREIREGLGDVHAFRAALWSTWAAKSVPDLVAAAPAFLVMDMTPIQMEAMGEYYGYSRARARFLSGWKRDATERLYRQAAHLFPWNDWVAASLRDGYGVPPEKITPISPGVDIDLYRPDDGVRSEDGVLRLLFVGGDFRRKGGDLLLHWARTTRTAIPWEIHIVTRDPVPDTPGVIVHRGLTNNSPELIRLYQQSDIFVLPTRADCYSLVGIEAMATGLPVILSRLGGIPEIVREGRTGFLIAPGDGDALAERLEYLMERPQERRRMGAQSRADVQIRFDARRNVRRMLEIMWRITG